MLIDILGADPDHGAASREAMRICIEEGSIVACDIVWAEVATGFEDGAAAAELLISLGVAFSPLERAASLAAADAFRAYRRGGGRRTRVAADFLIGAYALVQADRLLTRDRGFFGAYFGTLVVIDPAA